MTAENIIAIIGIAITAIFSGLVWKATQATAAATEETLKLNISLAKEAALRVEEQNSKMRRLHILSILEKSEIAENILALEYGEKIFSSLKTSTVKLETDFKELADYFSQEEIGVVGRAWKSFNELKAKYTETRYGGEKLIELAKESESVLEQLNAVINRFQK